jgi:hypothetical protein
MDTSMLSLGRAAFLPAYHVHAQLEPRLALGTRPGMVTGLSTRARGSASDGSPPLRYVGVRLAD